MAVHIKLRKVGLINKGEREIKFVSGRCWLGVTAKTVRELVKAGIAVRARMGWGFYQSAEAYARSLQKPARRRVWRRVLRAWTISSVVTLRG